MTLGERVSSKKPVWADWDHHQKYRQIHKNREDYCRQGRLRAVDKKGREVFLDGRYITDIPSFYLSLGEALNGDNGYFGACLDSLHDCLFGGFGVAPPFTIHITNAPDIECALGKLAWVQMNRERKLGMCEQDESIEQLQE
ncbi:hypothetical protein EUZ85_08140 [Hahella sp. KA22]|nr:hypothetical protein ENC22_05590 [Hahella sp. KA22]QAY54058.1 hypothetical protein EUZ85_08140 [Hahella sp. KA22]